MKYNFDNLPSRFNINSLKWDVKNNELPMWVADMDFEVAPKIKEALLERVNKGTFGYSICGDEFYDSFINFMELRHNIKYKKEDIIMSTGAVPAISSMVRKLTTPAEKVVLMTPVYNIFFNSIFNNGRYIYESPLIYNRDNQEYSIDFKDLEDKLSDNQTTLLILCNPHNPVGKIWSKEELLKIIELARKYNVTIISDELHCDIVRPGLKYNPILSLTKEDDNVIAIMSASKCFNLAGLQAAYVVCPNKNLNWKVKRGLNTDEVAEGNAFYNDAFVAAFNSIDWLDEVNAYIELNKRYAYEFLSKIPGVKVIKGDATYLLWVDIKDITNDSLKFTTFLREKTGLYITEGIEYGNTGEGFVRINLATSLSNVIDGMNRFKMGIKLFK